MHDVVISAQKWAKWILRRAEKERNREKERNEKKRKGARKLDEER